jgi:hypothetical protein
MSRTIAAIVAGFVDWTVLWLLANAGARRLMPGAFGDGTAFVGDSTLLLVLVVASVCCSISAGACVGLIARPPVRSAALVLGGILLAVGIAVQASVWSLMPVWYHVLFLALLMPATLISAQLFSSIGARARTQRA